MWSEVRVLIISSTLEVGGSETKIVKIANALSNRGLPVELAYLNPPDTLRKKIGENVAVTHLGRKGKYSMKSLRLFRRMLEGGSCIVLTVNFYPLLYAIPARTLATGRHRILGLVNTTEFVARERMLGYLYAPLLKRCDKIVFGSANQQASWIAKYRLRSTCSVHIHNGVDTAYYSSPVGTRGSIPFREKHGICPDAVVIGSVGRLAPEKNFALLIDAVSALKADNRKAYLLLAGDGAEREALKQRACARGIADRVVFAGVLEDVRTAVSCMDIFVLPSKAVETFSNAALEAMSMSRPAILSDIGGASEMIEHCRNGFLFPNGDLSSLVRRLTHLYDHPSERYLVGEAARARVLERFQFSQMVGSYEALIEGEKLAILRSLK